MGMISKTLDRLPPWVQVLLAIAAIPASIYGVVHYGFWSFVLRVIFSPAI